MRNASTGGEDIVRPPAPSGRISKAKKGRRLHECTFPGCGKLFTRAEHRRRHELNHNSAIAVESAQEIKRPDRDYFDQLSEFHKQYGTSLEVLPSIDQRPVDLYKLKKAVEVRGGFANVCEDEKWTEIADDLGSSGDTISRHGPSLKNTYQRWLHPYNEWLQLTEPSVQTKVEKSAYQPDSPLSDQGLDVKGAEVESGTEERNDLSIGSLVHPLSQPQDWSTLPSSRNSIYPSITASAPLQSNSSALADHARRLLSVFDEGLDEFEQLPEMDTIFELHRLESLMSQDQDHYKMAALPTIQPKVNGRHERGVSEFGDQVKPTESNPDNVSHTSDLHQCLRCSLAFKSIEDLTWHNSAEHPVWSRLSCDVPGCKDVSGFDTQHHLNQHRGVVHKLPSKFSTKGRALDHSIKIHNPQSPGSFSGRADTAILAAQTEIDRNIDMMPLLTRQSASSPLPACWNCQTLQVECDLSNSHPCLNCVKRRIVCTWGPQGVECPEPADLDPSIQDASRYSTIHASGQQEYLEEVPSSIQAASTDVHVEGNVKGSKQEHDNQVREVQQAMQRDYERRVRGVQEAAAKDASSLSGTEQASGVTHRSMPSKSHKALAGRRRDTHDFEFGSTGNIESLTDIATDAESLDEPHYAVRKNDTRPEKCPIVDCEYNKKGFKRKYERNRHALTHYRETIVCGFCPSSGPGAKTSFNRVDVFKRHLASVHKVEQVRPNDKGSFTRELNRKLSRYSRDATRKCSTCQLTFNNAQTFNEHLDDCVLQAIVSQFGKVSQALDHTVVEQMKISTDESGSPPEPGSDIHTCSKDTSKFDYATAGRPRPYTGIEATSQVLEKMLTIEVNGGIVEFASGLRKFLEAEGKPIETTAQICGRSVDISQFCKAVFKYGGSKEITRLHHWSLVAQHLQFMPQQVSEAVEELKQWWSDNVRIFEALWIKEQHQRGQIVQDRKQDHTSPTGGNRQPDSIDIDDCNNSNIGSITNEGGKEGRRFAAGNMLSEIASRKATFLAQPPQITSLPLPWMSMDKSTPMEYSQQPNIQEHMPLRHVILNPRSHIPQDMSDERILNEGIARAGSDVQSSPGHLDSLGPPATVVQSRMPDPSGAPSQPPSSDPELLQTEVRFSGLAVLSIGSWRRVAYSSEQLAIYYSTETEQIIYHTSFESSRYKIIYPFGYIKDIKWTITEFGVAHIVVELTGPPSFYVGGLVGDYKRGDFTENQQASKTLIHNWDGKSSELIPQLRSFMSLPHYQQRFQRFMLGTNRGFKPRTELYVHHDDYRTALEAYNNTTPLTFRDLSSYGAGTATIPMRSVPTDSGYASLTRDKLETGTVGANVAHIGLNLQSDHDDAKTVYSDGASVETSRRDSFVDRLAELLRQSLKDVKISDTTAREVFKDIKDCLADFATRLGQETSSPKLRRAMAFIHKYRSLVGSSFRNLLLQSPGEEEDVKTNSADNMPLGELMSRWFNDESAEAPTAPNDLAVLEDDITSDDPVLHDDLGELDTYSDLVSASEAYKWLISRLKNKALLDYKHSEAYRNVRETVLAYIPKEAVVRVGTPSTTVQTVFVVDWPIENFLASQLGSEAEATILGRIVTLTGVSPDIQAMTCNDYLCQTWPTTGMYLMKVVGKSLRSESLSAEIRRPDGASIAVIFEEMICTVSISGSRDMVIELAEQLSWLCAALRSAHNTTNIMTCTPIVVAQEAAARGEDLPAASDKLHTPMLESNRSGQRKGSLPQHLTRGAGEADGEVHMFEIRFEYTRLYMGPQEGMCWQYVLPHCNIVNGFPVQRRTEPGLGMEVPLNIMAGLVGTKRVNQYRETVFIRGFSAIYSPMKVVDDTIVWHLTCDCTGGHVSYSNVPEDVEHIGFADLEDKRHIVGWCTSVTNRIGADGNVDLVAEPQLPGTRPGCVFDNFVLTFPKEILYGPTFALLRCQKSIHLASATYRAKLKYLRDHFALLWDTEDDRGWLTNCLAAFLHLVRDTFVSYDGPTQVELMSLWERLRLIARDVPAHGSLDPVAHCSSWLSIDRGSHTSVDKDDLSVAEVAHQIFTRVCDQLFDGLDKLITFQEQVEYDDSRRTSRSLRLLEGWRFPDLASEHGSKRARVLSLPTIAFSWAKLLRSLSTVTIFGERFGELLVPCKPLSKPHIQPQSEVRSACQNLDSSRFLVAVAMRDLRVKMRKFKHCTGALLLGDAVILPKYASVFTKCSHRSGQGKCMFESHKSILMPWPVAHRKLLPMTSSECQCENVVRPKDFADYYIDGAVVLGHDEEAGYYLDEAGHPIKGTPPDPSVEQEEAFNDSGFGTDSSRFSQENIVSRIATRSTDEVSAQDSGILLKERVQSYNDSVVNGGAPVYGNIYVTNNNHMLAATQTSYLGMRNTPTPIQQQLSAPALLNRPPASFDPGYSRGPTPEFPSNRPLTGSKRSRSDSSESTEPDKRRRPASHTWDHRNSLHNTNRDLRSASLEMNHVDVHHQAASCSRPTTTDQVKRCCRCRTAMSVEKPTDECEECVHEFCIGCGGLQFDSTPAYRCSSYD